MHLLTASSKFKLQSHHKAKHLVLFKENSDKLFLLRSRHALHGGVIGHPE
jgi:hypothetical protein